MNPSPLLSRNLSCLIRMTIVLGVELSYREGRGVLMAAPDKDKEKEIREAEKKYREGVEADKKAQLARRQQQK